MIFEMPHMFCAHGAIENLTISNGGQKAEMEFASVVPWASMDFRIFVFTAIEERA